jgi:PPOX class probable F420-dependent enzyme
MAQAIPEKYKDLFDKKAFANLATLMPDGSLQVTPVWVDYDGAYVVVNSARGRQKDKNMKHNSTVALSILDPENPYRYLEVRGQVAEITEQGAEEHIDKMAKKYMGLETYPYRREGEVRVIYKIEPRHFTAMG